MPRGTETKSGCTAPPPFEADSALTFTFTSTSTFTYGGSTGAGPPGTRSNTACTLRSAFTFSNVKVPSAARSAGASTPSITSFART